ncbi:MAG: hypothetical protein BMS9Abin29_1065 [Gemmatimonadota bacterium]|nr:MAG: hypothetical protein BMS9Abin29_1065 [Gemmatimonadota bacterium]
MRTRFLSRAGFIGVISMWATGCGYLFVTGPPVGHEQLMAVSCTDSKTLPLVDAIWAGFSAADLLGSFAGDGESRDTNIAVSAAAAVVWGLAASKGYEKVRECRAAKELWARRTLGQGPDELGHLLVPFEASEPLKGPLPPRRQ